MMKLSEAYASISDKTEDKVNKKILSDDAYAICEFLEDLSARISTLRLRNG